MLVTADDVALSTRIHTCASWPSSYPEMKFGRMPGNYIMFKHNRLPRYIAVRSELVGTGSAGAAYPLSGAFFKYFYPSDFFHLRL